MTKRSGVLYWARESIESDKFLGPATSQKSVRRCSEILNALREMCAVALIALAAQRQALLISRD